MAQHAATNFDIPQDTLLGHFSGRTVSTRRLETGRTRALSVYVVMYVCKLCRSEKYVRALESGAKTFTSIQTLLMITYE